jgi:hypothetical protein
MSGGKGGGQSTKVEIPAWAEQATKENLNRAKDVQQIGYMPYYGPDVAAFTPSQQMAMQSNMDAAAAFGLAPAGQNAMAGMPQAEDFAGGISGYSSGGLFDQAVAELASREPEYTKRYEALFDGNAVSNPYINFGNFIAPSRPTSQVSPSASQTQIPSEVFNDSKMPIGLQNAYNAAPSIMPPQVSMAPPQAPLSAMIQPSMPALNMDSNLMDLPLPEMSAPAQVPALANKLPTPKANVDEMMMMMRNSGRMK